MDDDVDEVDQDPLPFLHPLRANREQAMLLLELEGHLLRNRLDLAGVAAAHDHEEVGVVNNTTHVEQDDVGRELLGAVLGGQLGELCAIAQRMSSTHVMA